MLPAREHFRKHHVTSPQTWPQEVDIVFRMSSGTNDETGKKTVGCQTLLWGEVRRLVVSCRIQLRWRVSRSPQAEAPGVVSTTIPKLNQGKPSATQEQYSLGNVQLASTAATVHVRCICECLRSFGMAALGRQPTQRFVSDGRTACGCNVSFGTRLLISSLCIASATASSARRAATPKTDGVASVLPSHR